MTIGGRSQRSRAGQGQDTESPPLPSPGNPEVGPDGEDVSQAVLAQTWEGSCVRKLKEHFISLQALLTPRLASHQPSCPLFFSEIILSSL